MLSLAGFNAYAACRTYLKIAHNNLKSVKLPCWFVMTRRRAFDTIGLDAIRCARYRTHCR